MAHRLYDRLGEVQRAMQDEADGIEKRAQPGAAGEYLRGVAHGHRKAAELLGRSVLSGELRQFIEEPDGSLPAPSAASKVEPSPDGISRRIS